MYITFLLLEISIEKKTNHTNLEVNQMLNPILVPNLINLRDTLQLNEKNQNIK